ncbi:hypothetical protein AYI68_g5387, partial [Smittium mucronatum]
SSSSSPTQAPSSSPGIPTQSPTISSLPPYSSSNPSMTSSTLPTQRPYGCDRASIRKIFKIIRIRDLNDLAKLERAYYMTMIKGLRIGHNRWIKSRLRAYARFRKHLIKCGLIGGKPNTTRSRNTQTPSSTYPPSSPTPTPISSSPTTSSLSSSQTIYSTSSSSTLNPSLLSSSTSFSSPSSTYSSTCSSTSRSSTCNSNPSRSFDKSRSKCCANSKFYSRTRSIPTFTRCLSSSFTQTSSITSSNNNCRATNTTSSQMTTTSTKTNCSNNSSSSISPNGPNSGCKIVKLCSLLKKIGVRHIGGLELLERMYQMHKRDKKVGADLCKKVTLKMKSYISYRHLLFYFGNFKFNGRRFQKMRSIARICDFSENTKGPYFQDEANENRHKKHKKNCGCNNDESEENNSENE